MFTLDKDWKIHKCNDIDIEQVESSVLMTKDVENNCYVLCYEEVTHNCVSKLLKNYADSDKKEQKNKKDKKRPLTSSIEVISKCGAISIHASDISTCNGDVWLNDQIINAYFSLITKANPLVGAMDAFFFVDVVMKKDLSRWLKPELFDKHMLFIPAIYRNHWRLVVWDLLNSRVETYDSGQTESDTIQPFIHQILTQKECPRSRCAIQIKKNLPKQNNMYDCGVFVCLFAKHVALHREINFTADEMPELRKQVALEILGDRKSVV